MNRFIEEHADDLGIRHPEELAIFIDRRAKGFNRREIAPEIELSERTLATWSEKLLEMDREDLSDLVLESIREVSSI